MFERFTTQARSVVTHAQQQARGLEHPSIGTHHLLLGILDEPDTAGGRAPGALGLDGDEVRDDVRRFERDRAAFSEEDADALRSVGIDLDEVRRTVEEAFGPGALEGSTSGRRGLGAGHVPFTAESKKALELALRDALHLGHRYIGTEHLLLGLVRDEGSSAARILSARGRRPRARSRRGSTSGRGRRRSARTHRLSKTVAAGSRYEGIVPRPRGFQSGPTDPPG